MPFAPSSVTASIGPPLTVGTVSVSWTASSDPQATRYNVDRSNNFESFFRVATNTTSRTLSQSIVAGVTSQWRVQAVGSLGNVSSFRNSNSVTRAPNAPASISLERTSNLANIAVSWSSSGGATSYRLEISQDGGSFSLFATYTGTSTTIGPLTRGSSYRFRVRASNAGGSSDFTTSGSLTLVPFRPDSVSASLASDTSIRVTWPAPNGATSYRVQRSVNGGGYSDVETTTSRDRTYSSLTRGSTYTFRVWSRNAGGESPTSRDSNPVQTPFPPPSAPSSASISKNKRDVTISLGAATAPSGTTISSYEIQIKAGSGSYGNTRTVSTSDRSTTYTSLSPSVTYQGRGRAIGTGGAGDWRESGTVTISSLPTAPSSLSLTKNKRDITAVSGTSSAASDVTISSYTYELRLSTDNGTTWGAWGTARTSNTTNRTVTYTNLNPSTTYQVRSRAESDFGFSAWRESNVVTLSPPPQPPSTISAIRSIRNVTVSLGTSSAASDVTVSGYEIQRRESTNGGATWGAWGTTRTTGTTDRTTTYTSLNYFSTYQFRGRALSDFGPSDYTTSGTVFIPGLPQPPQQVMALQEGAAVRVIVTSPTSDGGTPILTYRIEKRVSEDFETTWSAWGDAVVIPANQPVYLYNNLALQKTYQFRALATNEMGNSESLTQSNAVYLPTIVKIRDGLVFRLPNDYKRYDAQIGTWIGLSTYKRYFNGQWVNLQ